jgi:hypothetical protein
MDFEEVAAGILSFEKESSRNHAKTELDRWRGNLERETEVRVLRKLLWDKFTRGKAAEREIESLSGEPHPLQAYLQKCHVPPGRVSRCLDEVRGDFDRLMDQAGEGGNT